LQIQLRRGRGGKNASKKEGGRKKEKRDSKLIPRRGEGKEGKLRPFGEGLVKGQSFMVNGRGERKGGTAAHAQESRKKKGKGGRFAAE